MSGETEYPEAWGVLRIDIPEDLESDEGSEFYWWDICHIEDVAREKIEEFASAESSGMVVRLLPQPVVDRIIAEAVAKAERGPASETWILVTEHRKAVRDE